MTRRRPMKAEITAERQTAARWLDAWALDPDTMNDWARLVAAVPISETEMRVTIAVDRTKYAAHAVKSPQEIARRFPFYLSLIAGDVHDAHAKRTI